MLKKVMHLREGQRAPVHYHKNKMEDIINGGGGNIILSLWRLDSDGKPSRSPLDVGVDGIARRASAGDEICLRPGESARVQPFVCHQFWSAVGTGDTLSMEVSSVCDNLSDNCWLEPDRRFVFRKLMRMSRAVICSAESIRAPGRSSNVKMQYKLFSV